MARRWRPCRSVERRSPSGTSTFSVATTWTPAVASGGSGIALAMLGLSLGPVAEELFFCGWLLRSIEDALGGRRSFAALACAFAFAAVRPPVLLVPFFVLGVVASLLASRSRSIGPGVVAHVLHNGVTLLATSVF